MLNNILCKEDRNEKEVMSYELIELGRRRIIITKAASGYLDGTPGNNIPTTYFHGREPFRPMERPSYCMVDYLK
jgi:hypothetical protein